MGAERCRRAAERTSDRAVYSGDGNFLGSDSTNTTALGALKPSSRCLSVAISFWEKRENADAYQRGAYPDVLKAVAKVADGAPQVQTSEVSNSTWHKIAAR